MILVTGANGFVGTALCRYLENTGASVRGALRRRGQSQSQVDGVQYVQIGEIGPATDWVAALEGIEVVVHLAARVHVMTEHASDPLAEFRAGNTAGTERLARLAADRGVRRFVYLSSIKVNGEATNGPAFADGDVPHPQDPYAISKWEAEQALHHISAETGMEVVIIRPPLVYGPGVGGNFLRLMLLVRRGLPLPLASIANRRSLIYLDNLADVITLCANHPKAAGETFLVSDGEDLSTPELMTRLSRECGISCRLLPFPPVGLRLLGKLGGKSAEINRLMDSLQIDSSRIRKQLGWTPPYSVDQGLALTAGWFQRSLS